MMARPEGPRRRAGRSVFRSMLADTTPLQSPEFKRLWIANIITVIGAQLNVIVVPMQIYVITTVLPTSASPERSAWCPW